MSMSYTDIAAANAQTQRAQAASQAAYQSAQARNLGEQAAIERAKLAWQQEMDKANLTGMYQGQYTMPTQMNFATTFGTWGAPTAGEQTLAGNQQAYLQAFNNAMAYGQYYAPGGAGPTPGQQTQQAQQQAFQQAQDLAAMYGTAYAPGGAGPAAGTQTMAGQQQQFTQGLQTEQEARAAQAQQQQQAMGYLNLLSSLRGPADWAKYQQVLGSTPGGLRDLTAAAMGQYVPGGGATTGYQPQAASLQSLMGDVSGNPYSGQGGGQLNTPNVYGQNTQAMYGQPQVPQQQYALQALQQQMAPGQQQGELQGQFRTGYYPPANQIAPGQQPWAQPSLGGVPYNTDRAAYALGTSQPNLQPKYTNAQAGAAMGGAGAAPGSQDNPFGQMPLPNQISAQSWKNFTPSQQQMYLGGYESQGWDKGDVQALMNQALPKYATNSPTAGTWRLQ